MTESNAEPIQKPKKRGRRRTFEDIDAFQHVTNILLEGGMSAFSLPALARRVGCSHQSLSERFASRAGLLQAYRNWTNSIFRENVLEIRKQTPSPIEQVRQLLLMPLDPRIVGTDGVFAPGLWVILSLEFRREAVLVESITDGQRRLGELLRSMVEDAQQQDELREGDPGLIAEALLTATTGAAVLWLLRPVDEILEKMERSFEGTLARFMP
jgi:AcrR family transcriptional regulator